MRRCLRLALLRLWRLGLVLWVCRVPIASTVLAGVLLVMTPQGRDFFADLGMSWFHWSVFFVLCFCWAWIVHGSARHALQCDDWVAESHRLGGMSQERR